MAMIEGLWNGSLEIYSQLLALILISFSIARYFWTKITVLEKEIGEKMKKTIEPDNKGMVEMLLKDGQRQVDA